MNTKLSLNRNEKAGKWIKVMMLLLSVFIWVLIANEILNISSAQEPVIKMKRQGVVAVADSEPIELSLQYADPFLKGVKAEKVPKKVKHMTVQPLEIKHIIALSWPELKFKGTIGNVKSGKMTAIVEFNKNEILISEGDGLGETTVYRVTADSIVLVQKEKLKSYRLNS